MKKALLVIGVVLMMAGPGWSGGYEQQQREAAARAGFTPSPHLEQLWATERRVLTEYRKWKVEWDKEQEIASANFKAGTWDGPHQRQQYVIAIVENLSSLLYMLYYRQAIADPCMEGETITFTRVDSLSPSSYSVPELDAVLAELQDMLWTAHVEMEATSWLDWSNRYDGFVSNVNEWMWSMGIGEHPLGDEVRRSVVYPSYKLPRTIERFREENPSCKLYCMDKKDWDFTIEFISCEVSKPNHN